MTLVFNWEYYFIKNNLIGLSVALSTYAVTNSDQAFVLDRIFFVIKFILKAFLFHSNVLEAQR